jgi:hypothetical protein
MHTHLQQFDGQWQLPPVSANAPLFVLAAGWRSGSTMVQRLLCSSQEVIVWGEPYARCELVQHLCQAAQGLNGQYPNEGHVPEIKALNGLENQWIANLFPPVRDLKGSFRSALDGLLARPAFREGLSRYGLKEVRLDAEHGRFLHWIYPDARFVALVRNPWDAWRSAKGMDLYLHWPDTPVNGPEIFAKHWLRLVESFADWKDEAVFFVRYEDLISHPKAAIAVAAHCQLDRVDEQVLKKVIGSSGARPPLPADDIAIIESVAGSAARELGYTPEAVRQVA